MLLKLCSTAIWIGSTGRAAEIKRLFSGVRFSGPFSRLSRGKGLFNFFVQLETAEQPYAL